MNSESDEDDDLNIRRSKSQLKKDKCKYSEQNKGHALEFHPPKNKEYRHLTSKQKKRSKNRRHYMHNSA